MGCGNGLLVHILTCEGHTGLGIDVRSRKIWELYPEGTANLVVMYNISFGFFLHK